MTENDQNTVSQTRPRGRWGWLLWSVLVLVVLLGAAAGALYSQAGRPIKAPEWLHARVEERLAGALPGANIRFGDLSFMVPRNGRPRIMLRDAEISTDDGRPVITLANLEARVAFGPLLEGKVLLGRLRLSGATVNVRRRADGSFDLSFGALPEARQAASLAELITGLDDMLMSPELEALSLVEADGLTLQYEDARAGRAWTVDGARIVMNRDGDDLQIRGDLALLGGYDYATTLELNYESRIGAVQSRFGMSFEDMAARDISSQVAALAWLEALRAPISGALRVGLDEEGKLGPLSGTLQISEGVLQPTDQTTPVPFDAARAYFTYDPAIQTLRFDELSVEGQWVSGRAEGKALLVGMETGRPTALLGQFRMSGLRANPDGIYPAPVTLDRADMTFRLGLAPFDFTMGEMSLSKDGHVVVLDGRLTAAPDGWRLAVNGEVEEIARDTVLDFWPEQVKPKTRTWVADNIEALVLTNTQLAYRVRQGEKPQLYLGSEFREGEIRFMKTMPLLNGAAGRAELMNERFVVTAAKGTVLAPQGGPVDVTGTSLIIDDVRIKNGPPAVVRLVADGTITATLSLLDQEPLSVMTKAKRPVTLADGRATAQGDIKLRLKKGQPMSAVQFDIKGVLSAVRSTKLIPDRVLAASKLQVHATNERVTIRGKGRVGQVPFEAVWASQIRDNPGKVSRVEGTATLSQAFLDEFNIGLPRGTVSGAGPAGFAIDLAEGQEPVYSASSTLEGVGLSIPQLNWSLPQGTSGNLSVQGRLGPVPSVDRITLDAPGLEATGAVKLNADGLDRAVFSQIKAGGWLDAPVTLIGRGKGVAPAVELEGGWADVGRMNLGSGGGGGTSGGNGEAIPVTVRLDKLQVTESIYLSRFRGNFTVQGGTRGNFTGLVGGTARIEGEMVPHDTRSKFTITSSEEGGEVISAAGLLNKASKGDLQLTLTPVGRDSYDGRLKGQGIWLKDAPAIANLLSAASIIGLLEQMSGGGILFSEVDVKFRMTPAQVVVTKSSAVGASIGLSMDGIFDIASKTMDMQGVFSPVYAVNAIGSVLTRKGEGLIGFNFSMRGKADNPKVSINPLSIFTPGMFRDIFRRPPPKVSQ